MYQLGTVFLDTGWYVARVFHKAERDPEHGVCHCGQSDKVVEVRFKTREELDHPLADAIWAKVEAGGLKTEEEWSAGDGFPDDEWEAK